jgi:hypothetical protein
MKGIQLADLVNVGDPQSTLSEVHEIAVMMFPGFDCDTVDTVFKDIVRLFQGQYPGYRGCTTEYHDLKHTTETFLAMARLMHGVSCGGESFTREQLNLGLICALMHDTGYIQTVDDDLGTGAKYTLVHIERSIAFMSRYGAERGFANEDLGGYPGILRCTGLECEMSKIRFSCRQVELLGKILGTADLLGQIADRSYLEKLLVLFSEFREAGVREYRTELDLLKNTPGFYTMTRERFAREFEGVNEYMRHHFKARWNLDRDLYMEAIEKNISYLKFILGNHEKDYRHYLRRGADMAGKQAFARYW